MFERPKGIKVGDKGMNKGTKEEGFKDSLMYVCENMH